MYQNEVEKKEKRKIIATVTVATAVILILIAAIIVVATEKAHTNTSQQAETSQTVTEPANDAEVTESAEAAESTESAENAGENTENSAVVGTLTTEEYVFDETTGASVTAETSAEMPTTGAEDLLPLGLVAGMLVAYLVSRKITKED